MRLSTWQILRTGKWIAKASCSWNSVCNVWGRLSYWSWNGRQAHVVWWLNAIYNTPCSIVYNSDKFDIGILYQAAWRVILSFSIVYYYYFYLLWLASNDAQLFNEITPYWFFSPFCTFFGYGNGACTLLCFHSVSQCFASTGKWNVREFKESAGLLNITLMCWAYICIRLLWLL